jgi:serine/threonine protein kinase
MTRRLRDDTQPQEGGEVPDTGRLIGQVFAGRYRLEELVGRGGMGHVFRATHLTMNKVVALKVLSSEMAVDPENVARFEREAAAASELRHPNTIHMFDFGTSDRGELFLGMEFLEGRTLAKCLEEDGPFSPARACRVFRQLMESLEEAHSKDIIHRDLKPENVFLTDYHRSGDFVKVLDFGIAKFRRTDQIKQTLTRTGFVCGTPQYLAPEQGLGTAVSPATDLYSAGVVLFELLTGMPPFTGDDPVSLVMKHIHEAPPRIPAEVRVNLPDGLSALLRELLEKDPRRRPRSATQVVERLDALDVLSEEAPPRPAYESTAPEAGPTLVGRPTPMADGSLGSGAQMLSTTPLSGTAIDATIRMTAPSHLEGALPSRWRVTLSLLFILVAVAGLGLWRPWERNALAVAEADGASGGELLRTAASAPEPEPARDPAPDPEPPRDPAPDPESAPDPEPAPDPDPVGAVASPAADVPAPEPTAIVRPPSPAPSPSPAHRLRITSTPGGAQVTVDDAALGSTPIGLLVGDGEEPIRVTVGLDGFERQEWVFVPAEVRGRVGEKEFVLVPHPAASKPLGATGLPADGPPRGPRPEDGSPFGDLW